VETGDGHRSASSVRFDRGEGASRDWQAIAAVCQALGSEARLGLLRALERRPRTTGELLAAVGLDRGAGRGPAAPAGRGSGAAELS
jgi:hypothetical protein